MSDSHTRSYHVVAFSMPIVYTLEGDHDPNGMVYVLKPIRELLQWAKDRWNDNDRLLPRLHFRRQRVQLVIDGLERLDAMVERLRDGTASDRALLVEMLGREELAEDEDLGAEERRREDRPEDARAMAVRLNVQRQIDELTVALRDLEDIDGPNSWNQPVPLGKDAELAELDRLDPLKPLRLVTLTSAQRMEWRQEWIVQGKLLDRAIEQWFERCEDDPKRRFDAQKLLKDNPLKSKDDEQWVRRLLLNDHKPGTDRGLPFDRFNPMKPIPAVRPLVLRCHEKDRVEIIFENSLRSRHVGFHVQGEGMSTAEGSGVYYADGAAIGQNQDSTVAPKQTIVFHYDAKHEGIWPINDLGDVRGTELGTNAHGLFGAIIVEAPETKWRDPETGEDLTDKDWCSLLDVDIIPDDENTSHPRHKDFVDFYYDRVVLGDPVPRSFREFTVFIHDEPEVHSGLHTVGEHTVMPLSYRAEPMHNRLPHRMRKYVEETRFKPLPQGNAIDRTAVTWVLGDELDEQFWTARTSTGEWLERVAGEEQHHSSWLFGDPITHILRAYKGDPCRVRLIHGGVKETHVFHLHVHQWRAVASDTAKPSVRDPKNKGSQLLDSITIGPQSSMTIDPLYGSGSRQHAMGDIIWHCHLYPHFHHGMWGLWRSFDRLVDGNRPYPDGSYCPRLNPLPRRDPDPSTLETPGFPWFIDGEFPMKAPPPPVGDKTPLNGRRILLRMGAASRLERNAMPERCREGKTPGAIFVDLDTDAKEWNDKVDLPRPRVISYDVEVVTSPCHYNVDGWHDPRAHHYRLMKVEILEWSESEDRYSKSIYTETFEQIGDRNPSPFLPRANPNDPETLEQIRDRNPSPFFPRANHGDIVEWRQHNRLGSLPADGFDFGQLPVECGLHVHLVKFDPLSADGSSTGWNYLSGASCREAVGAERGDELRVVSRHRWVVDEEFGPCFFHDHLLANFRQKHGLFAALIAEPYNSQWLRADNQSLVAWSQTEAVVVPPKDSGLPPFREACLAIADFIPLLDRHKRPLNPPTTLSGDDDPGAMGVNYRNAPLTFRGQDPSQWFSSSARSRPNFDGMRGDPDTPIIRTYPGERLRIRLIQGSHEEQHGMAIHGMRWRRDWGNPKSTLVNQQTLGISEAFTLDINPAKDSHYGTGDHLWHFCAIDDLWLGCWGFVRSLLPTPENLASFSPLPDLKRSPEQARQLLRKSKAVPKLKDTDTVRTFVVVAQRTEHLYTEKLLTDPWGLIYRVANYQDNGAAITWKEIQAQKIEENEVKEEKIKIKVALEQAIARDFWEVEDDRIDKKEKNDLPIEDGCTDKSDENDKHDRLPLVLRARRGEWIRLILVNDILDDDDDLEEDGRIEFGVEPSPARLPLEHLDDLHRPDRRKVSPRVSIHASLLSYDVSKSDGSYVGLNLDSTIAPRRTYSNHTSHMGGADMESTVIHRMEHHGNRNWHEYWWYADKKLAPASHNQGEEGSGQVCYLYDMADIRNHRHHGLIGALIVEPGDVTPFKPYSEATGEGDGWTGINAEIRDKDNKVIARETAIFLQDGLRFFVNGNPDFPMPDVNPGDDPEDSGQKGINYRSHPVHHGVVSTEPTPVFPLLTAQPKDKVWLRLIGGNDKPRQHTVTIHGCAWLEARWAPQGAMTGAVSGFSPCRVENIAIELPYPGDYAVRAGAFRWAAEHGVWSSLRARSIG